MSACWMAMFYQKILLNLFQCLVILILTFMTVPVRVSRYPDLVYAQQQFSTTRKSLLCVRFPPQVILPYISISILIYYIWSFFLAIPCVGCRVYEKDVIVSEVVKVPQTLFFHSLTTNPLSLCSSTIYFNTASDSPQDSAAPGQPLRFYRWSGRCRL